MITAGVPGKLEYSFDPLKLFRAKFLSKYKVTSTTTRQVHFWSYSSLFLVDARENARCTMGLHVRMHAVPPRLHVRMHAVSLGLHVRMHAVPPGLHVRMLAVPRVYKWECTLYLVRMYVVPGTTRENAYKCIPYLGDCTWECIPYLRSSVPDPSPDPDPPDPHVFGPPGSGSFYPQAKIVRKTLIPTVFGLFIFEKWCKCTLQK